MNYPKISKLTLGLTALCLLAGAPGAAAEGLPAPGKKAAATAVASRPVIPPGPQQKAKNKGWEWLFDGKSTDKWRSVNSDRFPSTGWTIENGTLVMAGKGGGDLVTREQYSDFDLVFDFNLTPSANSGIKYFVGELKNTQTGKTTINGPEYQVIDDYNYPEIKDDPHGKSSTAAVYLLYAPQNKTLKPAGQWNQARIVAKGKEVSHWLNGVKVASYTRGSADFRERVAKTKFQPWANYGEAASGHIMLTDHGDKVYFRNIRIKRL